MKSPEIVLTLVKSRTRPMPTVPEYSTLPSPHHRLVLFPLTMYYGLSLLPTESPSLSPSSPFPHTLRCPSTPNATSITNPGHLVEKPEIPLPGCPPLAYNPSQLIRNLHNSPPGHRLMHASEFNGEAAEVVADVIEGVGRVV